jgi:hypothetical protein
MKHQSQCQYKSVPSLYFISEHLWQFLFTIMSLKVVDDVISLREAMQSLQRQLSSTQSRLETCMVELQELQELRDRDIQDCKGHFDIRLNDLEDTVVQQSLSILKISTLETQLDNISLTMQQQRLEPQDVYVSQYEINCLRDSLCGYGASKADEELRDYLIGEKIRLSPTGMLHSRLELKLLTLIFHSFNARYGKVRGRGVLISDIQGRQPLPRIQKVILKIIEDLVF